MTSKKNFCISPWVHIHTWPNGNVYPCCMTPMEDVVGNLKDNSLEEIWNSPNMKQLRKDFLDDKRPNSCKRCFEVEDSGQSSVRTMLNENFKNHLIKANDTEQNGEYKNFDIIYWDFRFSNICNFKCRTCGPQLSTAWFDDTKKIWGTLPVDALPVKAKTDIWEEIEPLFDTVEEIYFAGGEPLIMEQHYRILQKLDDMKRYDVRLRYNTNFSQLTYKNLQVDEIWKKFDSVSLSVSLDGYETRGEYIRKNMIWNKILENRKKLNPMPKNINFFINCTLSVMNSFHVVDFHRYCVKTGFIENPNQFRLNILQHPLYYRIQILPTAYKKKLIDHYRDYIEELKSYKNSDMIIDDFNSAINLIESENYSYELDNFKNNIKQLDDIRNENFLDIFTEFNELIA